REGFRAAHTLPPGTRPPTCRSLADYVARELTARKVSGSFAARAFRELAQEDRACHPERRRREGSAFGYLHCHAEHVLGALLACLSRTHAVSNRFRPDRHPRHPELLACLRPGRRQRVGRARAHLRDGVFAARLARAPRLVARSTH